MNTMTKRWDDDIALPEPRKNRRTTFMHRVEATLARGLLAISGAQRVEKAAHRMGLVLKTIGPMFGPIHNRGHVNLSLIYPDMTAAERAAILRGAWYNLGATFAEFAHLDKLADRTEVVNAKIIQDVIDRHGNAVFFSGHFANWEALPAKLYQMGLKNAVVYRPANNPIVDADIIKRRASAMTRYQLPKNKRSARSMLTVLKDGYSLCMLTDQKLNDGISVPLLGHPAMTAPAAARLALMQNVPMIPLQIERLPGSRFRVTAHPAIEIKTSGNTKDDTERLSAAMNEAIGHFILHRPDQWLIFHRRWPRRITG
ncbi:lysophospholipid acyltransferase family protein [Parvularcula sp. LCG005]|uniref:lysophospholipid acyltransferase family protein n=1 Tax=Parvularcula sp. LCG005 TaxID=3078805 RepID=UPI002942E5DC|nr:lysophospholipid acyltransferase family protein [Parvularcula sp. LCG005]WOI52061.1 lysophospholipid acyltransferase family protein [Parvularcula sp. LCG005]